MRYQCNGMRHNNNFLPNLFQAPAGGFNPAEPYANPAVPLLIFSKNQKLGAVCSPRKCDKMFISTLISGYPVNAGYPVSGPTLVYTSN